MRPKKLLSKGNTNAKTVKNQMETYILYLAPYTMNSRGQNLCPKATAGCAAACLFTAGRGSYSYVQKARLAKSEYYVQDRIGFLHQLSQELDKFDQRAAKQGKRIIVRLNGTSDLPLFEMLGAEHKWPNIVFYDYTKIVAKAIKFAQHPRYIVTLSRNEENEVECAEALELGVNVSVVFRDKFPEEYMGYPVIDGDQSDMMMFYNRGVIIGLKAKGKAKYDKSGFVV